MITELAIIGLIICSLGLVLSIIYPLKLKEFVQGLEKFAYSINPDKSKKIENPRKSMIKLFAILTFMCLIAAIVSTTESEKTSKGSLSRNEKATSGSPSATRDCKIDVTSVIVKKVDGKYRYFFDVRNNGSEGFIGKVKIYLITQSGTDEFDETFENTAPLAANYGNSVFFDIFNGPPSEFGADGISKFRYEVCQGELVIKNGSGSIKW